MSPAWRQRATAIALAGLAGDAFAKTPQDRAWAELEYFYSQIRSGARLNDQLRPIASRAAHPCVPRLRAAVPNPAVQ